MPTQKILRTGNSLAITLPAKFIRTLGVKAGDKVEVSFSFDQTSVTYVFKEARQLSLSPKILKETKL